MSSLPYQYFVNLIRKQTLLSEEFTGLCKQKDVSQKDIVYKYREFEDVILELCLHYLSCKIDKALSYYIVSKIIIALAESQAFDIHCVQDFEWLENAYRKAKQQHYKSKNPFKYIFVKLLPCKFLTRWKLKVNPLFNSE
jgi:hypothetical protein